MRNEKEFIEAMWQQIDRQEQDVLKNEQARQAYRKLTLRKTILAFAFVIISSVVVFFLKQYIASYIYIIAFIMISIAYIFETYENSIV
ncbi:MAG TPA: hypothetical protein VJ888_06345 [Mobilitalea sp.]|nr:hypothetical protein [Mobilitalea sp.]